jgi:hypothetical protein
MTAVPLRSLAGQGTADLGGRWSVLARQKSDHVRLEELLTELAGTPPGRQRRVLLALYRLVFPHAFAEETVLWPLMRRVLTDGEQLTLQVEQEHQEVNELVSALEDLRLPDPRRGPMLTRLAQVLREDVRDEEDELLPRLQGTLAPARLRVLGVLWEVVRRIAPTRPHPVVARRPPGNVVAALPLSLIDRTRDLLERVALRAGPANARRLSTLDHRLGRAAHALERLALMRAGEHPTTQNRSDGRSEDHLVIA